MENSRLIKKLNSFNKELKVKDVILLIEKEAQEKKQSEEEKLKEIMQKYQNKYFVYSKKHTHLGIDFFNIIHIWDFVERETTTDMEYVYKFEADNISIHNTFSISKVEDTHFYFNEKDLESFVEISEEDYFFCNDEYSRTRVIARNIIDKFFKE